MLFKGYVFKNGFSQFQFPCDELEISYKRRGNKFSVEIHYAYSTNFHGAEMLYHMFICPIICCFYMWRV